LTKLGLYIPVSSKQSGNLNIEGNVRIDGIFEGDLTADGTLFIGPLGQFIGEAHVSEAYVEGSFSGALESKYQTTLTASAVFKGILDTQQASVTKGAEIIGDVRICNRRSL